MSRTGFLTVALGLTLLWTGVSVRADQTDPARDPASLLVRAQAADISSQLLTHYCDLTLARVNLMQEYIKHLGKAEDYLKNGPPARDKVMQVTYDQAQSILAELIVKHDGGRFTDPVLTTLKEDKLEAELKALAKHNLALYEDLRRGRSAVDSMSAYLIELNKFDGYHKWADEQLRKLNEAAKAVVENPEARIDAETADKIVEAIRGEVRTKRAQALAAARQRGMTEAQFNQSWTRAYQTQQDFHQQHQRVEARLSQPLAAAGAAPTSGGAMRQNWNGWGDSYNDVFNPRYGPVYRRYDTRVNMDYDRRVNFESDRRTNLDFDRRQNVHFSARNNTNVPDSTRIQQFQQNNYNHRYSTRGRF
jgi:hypothetical protein